MKLHDLLYLDCGSIVYDMLLGIYYVLVGYVEETNKFVGLKVKNEKYCFDNMYRIDVQTDRYKYIKKVSDNDRVKILMSLHTSLIDLAPVRKRFINLKTLNPHVYIESLQKSLPEKFYKYANNVLYHAVVVNGFVYLDYELKGYTEDYMIGIVRES